jgi:glutamyl-tRNA reductase
MGEIEKCHLIVKEEVERFVKFLEEQEVSPVIASLKARMERIAEEELKKAFSKDMKDTPQDQKLRIERLTKRIINRILRGPALYLRECASNDGSVLLCKRIVSKMFNLEEERE